MASALAEATNVSTTRLSQEPTGFCRRIRVIPIAVTTWPDEVTRTANSACIWIAEATVEGCIWIAEATVEGRTYTARSRHGPANELARQLAALIEGEQSGPSEPFDFDRFLEGKRARQPG